jgi:hypothetical protein
LQAPVLRTQSVHRIPRSTFVTTRNAPPDERGTVMLYCCVYQIEKRDIFGGGAGHDGQISAFRVTCDICTVMAGLTRPAVVRTAIPGHNDLSTVIRGLDPRIHLLRKTNLAKQDGLPGQARQ